MQDDGLRPVAGREPPSAAANCGSTAIPEPAALPIPVTSPPERGTI